MNTTNYFSSIVKILENPVNIVSKEKTSRAEVRVEMAQFRNNKILNLIFRGKLAENVNNYYQVNDYILIEGYLAVKKKSENNSLNKNLKVIEVSVLKVYPLFLNYQREKK